MASCAYPPDFLAHKRLVGADRLEELGDLWNTSLELLALISQFSDRSKAFSTALFPMLMAVNGGGLVFVQKCVHSDTNLKWAVVEGGAIHA